MENFITRYSQTYILIGQLELILRSRLIETLSKYSLEKGYAEWHQVLNMKTTIDPNKRAPALGFGGKFYRSATSLNFGFLAPGMHSWIYLSRNPSKPTKRSITECITRSGLETEFVTLISLMYETLNTKKPI